MLERVEIDLDHDMVQRVMRGFHLADAREAVLSRCEPRSKPT
jgi:Arc/MetJ family transcription regulator